MSIILCSICDRLFDTDKQVNAHYHPVPECEDCLNEFEKQLQETWLQLDQDTQAIADFCEDKL